MFERLTDRSRRVLVLAQEEARRLGHPFIGSEHIFLGLVGEGDGVAARALSSAGIELQPAREAVRRMAGPERSEESSPPFTPGAKKVLELSLRETLALGSKTIGTEHLMLGLISQGDDMVESVLAAFGTDGDDLRRRVVDILRGGDPGDTPGPGRPAAAPGGTIERFFDRLTARDWESLGALLSSGVERIGPFGDRVTGRERYLDLLEASVPAEYGNDVHRVTYAADGRSGFARVTEHLTYPDRELHLEEAYSFHIDHGGHISLVEVFWQTPSSDDAPGPGATGAP